MSLKKTAENNFADTAVIIYMNNNQQLLTKGGYYVYIC